MEIDTSGRYSNLINLVAFQSVWFLTVLGAANNVLWPGLLGLAAFLILHYLVSHTALKDFRLALTAVLLGFIVEAAFVKAGLLIYPAATTSIASVPVWMLLLWANFALIMNGCISWLHGRYSLAAVLGFLGAPLSYYGGVKLGAADAPSPELLLVLVGVVYAVVTPALLYFAVRFAPSGTAAR